MSKTYNIEIKNIDLDMLREQKAKLLTLQHRVDADNRYVCRPEEFDAIEGIINIIDHIQDSAVEQYGLDEAEVFKFSNE
jgi:hypothetical protein